MSHFSVLVITKSRPSKIDLEGLMMPYHEFECTGYEAYIQEIDETEEMRKKFSINTSEYYKNEEGELFETYEDQFFRDPKEGELERAGVIGGTGAGNDISWHSRDWNDGKGYRTKVHYIPEEFTPVTKSIAEVKSFREWLKDCTNRQEILSISELNEETKYGYTLIDSNGEVVKTIKRTNPNYKWDWWEIGGRYRNRLLSTQGGVCDSERVGDIDFEVMKQTAVMRREESLEKVVKESLLSFEEINSLWAQYVKYGGWKAFIKEWENMEGRKGIRPHEAISLLPENHIIRKMRETDLLNKFSGMLGLDVDETEPNLENWVQSAPALSCYAINYDGQWEAIGEMGWFGCSSDEVTQAQWQATVDETLAKCSKDYWITVVDCHV